VVSAGIADEYTFVTLIPPANVGGDKNAVQK